jgi:mannose-6-phosphate isomerase-like protein (cupin superfamily)
MDNGSQDSPFKTFTVHPQLLASGKQSTSLVRSETVRCGVQVVAKGGETNLHAHSAADEIWHVLQGEATFYGEGDQVVARIGRNQGLLIPHGVPSWFESSRPENLVILRFGAKVGGEPDKRIDYADWTFVTQQGVEGGIKRQRQEGMVEWPVKMLEGQFFGD